MWFAELHAPAALSAVAGVVSLIIGAVLWFRNRQPSGTSATQPAKFGKGPHVNVRCAASDKFAITLATTTSELREAAEEGQWKINWSSFDEHQRNAETACQAGDHSQAVRHYAKAISYMMGELRQLENRKAGDSSIEY